MALRERTSLQFLINPEKKQKFVEAVEKSGKTLTEVLVELVEGYLCEAKVDVVTLEQRVEKIEDYLKKGRKFSP